MNNILQIITRNVFLLVFAIIILIIFLPVILFFIILHMIFGRKQIKGTFINFGSAFHGGHTNNTRKHPDGGTAPADTGTYDADFRVISSETIKDDRQQTQIQEEQQDK